jgi:hypothetical protein
VPKEKVFSHIAFITRKIYDNTAAQNPGKKLPHTYDEVVNFTPVNVAFGKSHNAGFSTYPQPGLINELEIELQKNGNPPWASAEGTAADPSQVERGNLVGSMETYLANRFNHGAVLVNIFGWGLGEGIVQNNPFRQIAEGPDAIAAYQKFLNQ